jgi:hypothetical protein
VIIGALAALGEGQEPESVKSIAAMGGHSIALTLEAGVKKDSGPYTFVHHAADCGEYRQAAGVIAQGCRGHKMDLVHLKVSEGCHASYS